MKIILNKFNTPYLKDILTSFTGTTISQIIPILMAPVLSRIYAPSDYGLLGIYMSITPILIVFVNLQYTQAILQTSTKKEEDNIVAICYLLTFFYTFLIIAIILILYIFEISFFVNAKLGYWLYFIPLTVFLSGITTVQTKILNKHRHYKIISTSQIASTIATVFCSLAFGILFKSYEGLFIGFFIGQITLFVSQIIFLKEIRIQQKNIDWSDIKNGMLKYKKFPLFSIPTEFLYGWTDQLPIYFFNAFYNTSVIGHYNYGKRMVSLPISFITGAVGNVFAQKAAEQVNETGECRKLFINTFKMMALPILPFFVLLAFFSPIIFGFVFGKEWTTAGEYVQILIPMFYLKAIVSPLSYMYVIKNKQDEDMILHIISFALVASSFYIGYVLKSNIKTILFLFSLSYCLIYITYLFRCYHFSKK